MTIIAASCRWILALSAVLAGFSAALVQAAEDTELQGETWTKRANMPTARFQLAACGLEGKIYAIGGTAVGGNAAGTAVEAYDPVTDSWAVKAALPTGRGWLVAETVNGKIYAIGGTSIILSSTSLRTVEEYDPAADRWTRKADMPTTREFFTSAVVGGKIYVIGGLTAANAPALATVEAYDPATDTWESKAAVPTARGALCASVVNGKIFAMGAGGPGFPHLSTVEMYDPQTDSWTRKASIPTARGVSAAGAAHGRIYVMGGRSLGGAALATVEEYDPVTDAWTRRTNIGLRDSDARVSIPLFGFAATEMNGRIYAIGGASGDDRVGLSQVLEYTPPVKAPALRMNRVMNAAQSVLRLEWTGYPDYLDIVQSKSQLEADDWSEVERFSGAGGTLAREIPAVEAASFYRLQRAPR